MSLKRYLLEKEFLAKGVSGRRIELGEIVDLELEIPRLIRLQKDVREDCVSTIKVIVQLVGRKEDGNNRERR